MYLPTAPFVLQCDKQAIVAFNASAKPDHTIHKEVLPVPFVGSPAAPILLLNPNPGFSKRHRQYREDKSYRQAFRDNLVPTRQDYSFYVLDHRIDTNP
jgi:hypothetical protein